MRKPLIRSEIPGDYDAIREVARCAFEGMPFADGDEHELVDALRAAEALAVSLVAEIDGRIVGHIAFSPARSPGDSSCWYALGPLSVLPALQRSGIGSALVLQGLEKIAELKGMGCILTGEPAYYSRFGFILSPALAPPEEPAEYFMIKQLGPQPPSIPLRFHEAFYGDA